MEYLGIKLEEEEAWIVSAFKETLTFKGSDIPLKEDQKRMLFVFFYSGILYGKSFYGSEGGK